MLFEIISGIKMTKKSKKRNKRQPAPQIYCDDCGELLDRTSAYYLELVREQTNMPNLPAFCCNCRLKIKNRLKGYWHGLKEGIKPHSE
jgi:hypothetical protein